MYCYVASGVKGVFCQKLLFFFCLFLKLHVFLFSKLEVYVCSVFLSDDQLILLSARYIIIVATASF